jgi:uncharacterized membrane protein
MDRTEIPMDLAGAHAAAQETYETHAAGGFGVNVGTLERWISAVIGGGLLYYGIRRRSLAGTLMALAGGNLLFRGSLGRSLIYRAFGINTAAGAEAAKQALSKGKFKVEKSITIDRPVQDVYGFWRNFENLPRVMRHLKEVRTIDERRSHWVAKAPAGIEIEWDAEMTEDQENQKIAWRSLESFEIKNSGVVLFERTSGGQATDVRVYMEYELPAGKIAKAFAKVFGKDPDKMIDEDLRRFKKTMETREAAHAA